MLYRDAPLPGDQYGTIAYICSAQPSSAKCSDTADALYDLVNACQSQDQYYAGGQNWVAWQDGKDEAHKLYVSVAQDPIASRAPDTTCPVTDGPMVLIP